MNRKPKVSPLVLSLCGVAVILGGVGGVVWCVTQGHAFSAFLVAAITLGLVVPLYPPEDEPANYV